MWLAATLTLQMFTEKFVIIQPISKIPACMKTEYSQLWSPEAEFDSTHSQSNSLPAILTFLCSATKCTCSQSGFMIISYMFRPFLGHHLARTKHKRFWNTSISHTSFLLSPRWWLVHSSWVIWRWRHQASPKRRYLQACVRCVMTQQWHCVVYCVYLEVIEPIYLPFAPNSSSVPIYMQGTGNPATVCDAFTVPFGTTTCFEGW